MKSAAHFVIRFIDRVRSRPSHKKHHAGSAATQIDNHAAHILHDSVIRMRSRLQSA